MSFKKLFKIRREDGSIALDCCPVSYSSKSKRLLGIEVAISFSPLRFCLGVVKGLKDWNLCLGPMWIRIGRKRL